MDNKMNMIRGQWVKQYNSGLWMIVDIVPHYADSDFDAKGVHYKKGELCGYLALLKKGFTSKMKFRTDSDVCDVNWCKPLSEEEQAWVNQYFAEHPKDLLKFRNYEFKDRLAVSSIWLNLSEHEEAQMIGLIESLPPKFTDRYLVNVMNERGLGHAVTNPPTSHILTLWSSIWELDENKERLYRNPSLEKVGH